MVSRNAEQAFAWELFAPTAIDPRVDAFNRMTAQALAQVPPVYTMPVDVARHERAHWTRFSGASDAEWVNVPWAPSPLRVRVLRAVGAKAVYLHVHGGGWVLGGADHQDDLLADIRA